MEKLRATGKFPRGKINPEDEGELRMAIAVQNGEVMIAFGKAVTWLSLPRDVALQFADKIREQALTLPHSS